MNPQLLKIAQRAGFSQQSDLDAFEMIAKLVVEECANVCYNLRYTNEGPSEGAAYQRTLCGSAIKENFGLISKGPISAKNVK
jgi:hypothetical protein